VPATFFAVFPDHLFEGEQFFATVASGLCWFGCGFVEVGVEAVLFFGVVVVASDADDFLMVMLKRLSATCALA